MISMEHLSHQMALFWYDYFSYNIGSLKLQNDLEMDDIQY